jgi:hypothetical protein
MEAILGDVNENGDRRVQLKELTEDERKSLSLNRMRARDFRLEDGERK